MENKEFYMIVENNKIQRQVSVWGYEFNDKTFYIFYNLGDGQPSTISDVNIFESFEEAKKEILKQLEERKTHIEKAIKEASEYSESEMLELEENTKKAFKNLENK